MRVWERMGDSRGPARPADTPRVCPRVKERGREGCVYASWTACSLKKAQRGRRGVLQPKSAIRVSQAEACLRVPTALGRQLGAARGQRAHGAPHTGLTAGQQLSADYTPSTGGLQGAGSLMAATRPRFADTETETQTG